jgi:hypothetical protein
MVPQSVLAVRLAKPKYRGLASNVRRVEHPLDWKPRAAVVPPVSTKIKTVQEQDMVVKIVLPEHTATKPNKVLHHRAKIVSRGDGPPRPAMASVLVLSGVLPVPRVCTMLKRDALVPLPASNAPLEDTTT